MMTYFLSSETVRVQVLMATSLSGFSGRAYFILCRFLLNFNQFGCHIKKQAELMKSITFLILSKATTATQPITLLNKLSLIDNPTHTAIESSPYE
jgi:hypothetical protein